MADGDNADTPILKSPVLLKRDLPKFSYFFNHHVEKCISEQHKLLGVRLSEKEKEADVTYDKSFSDLFCDEAQINSTFVHLILDSNEPTNLDGLIDDLAVFASTKGESETRLFDLLLVTCHVEKLLKEQKIRGAPYDLYDIEAKGRLRHMTTYAKLLSNSDVKPGDRTTNLALVLSMLATGQEPNMDAALMMMAKCLKLPWDALLLSRFYFGPNREITRRVHDAWSEVVLMKDEENKFRMIKMARSLNTSNLKVVAVNLMKEVGREGYEMIYAYRCLSLALAAVNSSQLTELKKMIEVMDVSTMMHSIFVTMLGWDKIDWAKCILADLAKRASFGDIPSEICQICLQCFVELVEVLLTSLEIGTDSFEASSELLTVTAERWRREMTDGHGEMRKLKSGHIGTLSVLIWWMQQLGEILQAPFLGEENLSSKMECVFLATKFLPEILRWAATGQEGDSLHLYWPERPITTTIDDESLIFPPDDDTIDETSSVVSSRTTVTPNDHSKTEEDDRENTEVQQRVTSCGVPYTFSSVKNEPVDRSVESMGEQQQIEKQVQQSAVNMRDSSLSVMDSATEAMGEVGGEDKDLSTRQISSPSLTTTDFEESLKEEESASEYVELPLRVTNEHEGVIASETGYSTAHSYPEISPPSRSSVRRFNLSLLLSLLVGVVIVVMGVIFSEALFDAFTHYRRQFYE